MGQNQVYFIERCPLLGGSFFLAFLLEREGERNTKDRRRESKRDREKREMDREILKIEGERVRETERGERWIEKY